MRQDTGESSVNLKGFCRPVVTFCSWYVFDCEPLESKGGGGGQKLIQIHHELDNRSVAPHGDIYELHDSHGLFNIAALQLLFWPLQCLGL